MGEPLPAGCCPDCGHQVRRLGGGQRARCRRCGVDAPWEECLRAAQLPAAGTEDDGPPSRPSAEAAVDALHATLLADVRGQLLADLDGLPAGQPVRCDSSQRTRRRAQPRVGGPGGT